MRLRVKCVGLAILVASVTALLGLPSPAAAERGSPTLTGETLFAAAVPELVGTSRVSGTCDPDGYSTFRFITTGSAYGPYEGTFTEIGSFTLAPAVVDEFGNSTQKPVAFRSFFVVHAGKTRIAGVKSLSPTSTEFGACGSALGAPATPNAILLQLSTRYKALIATRRGVVHDRGDSSVDYGDFGVRGIPDFQSFRFLETFPSA